MVLLIDAFNVVRAQWALPAARRGMDVRGLIARIGQSRFAGRRLRVVVDGNPGPEWRGHGVVDTLAGFAWTRVGRAEVVFSGRDAEADDVIEDILRRARGIEITVVSSDRRLIRAAGLAGASQIGNGSFLKLLEADLADRQGEAMPAFATDVPLDRYAIAHWMQEFGFDPNGLLNPPASLGTEPVDANPEPNPKPEPEHKPIEKPKRTKPPKGAGFGSTLGVRLPEPGFTPDPEPVQAPDAMQPHQPPEHEPLDPLLREAFQEWFGSLHLDDLDMGKWVDGVEPL